MFWSLNRSSTLPSSYRPGVPTLTLLGGSDSTLGNRKRTVPSVSPASEAVMAVMPRANQLPTSASRKKRRSLPAGWAGALAGGAGGLGEAGGGGGAGAGGVPVTFVVSDISIYSALSLESEPGRAAPESRFRRAAGVVNCFGGAGVPQPVLGGKGLSLYAQHPPDVRRRHRPDQALFG